MTKEQKAIDTLRVLKQRWGLTWDEMGECFDVRGKTLSVFCSDIKDTSSKPTMSEWFADTILAFADDKDPPLEFPDKRRSGSKIIVLFRDDVFIIAAPPVSLCEVCGAPFIPVGYGQRYCTGKRGKCGLEARRERYGRTH